MTPQWFSILTNSKKNPLAIYFSAVAPLDVTDGRKGESYYSWMCWWRWAGDIKNLRGKNKANMLKLRNDIQMKMLVSKSFNLFIYWLIINKIKGFWCRLTKLFYCYSMLHTYIIYFYRLFNILYSSSYQMKFDFRLKLVHFIKLNKTDQFIGIFVSLIIISADTALSELLLQNQTVDYLACSNYKKVTDRGEALSRDGSTTAFAYNGVTASQGRSDFDYFRRRSDTKR